MSNIGNEAKLIIALSKETVKAKLLERETQFPGTDYAKSRRDWKNGAEFVLELLTSIPNDLEKKRR